MDWNTTNAIFGNEAFSSRSFRALIHHQTIQHWASPNAGKLRSFRASQITNRSYVVSRNPKWVSPNLQGSFKTVNSKALKERDFSARTEGPGREM